MTGVLETTAPDELTAAEQALVDAVEQRREDLAELCCELISYDTTSRRTGDEPARQEAELQDALAQRLRRAGAKVEVWEPEPRDAGEHPLAGERTLSFRGRPQLVARFPHSDPLASSLLFNGHIDVVPAERADGWSHDPFNPVIADGRISGRGACDMKGGIAAMVIAAEVLAGAGEPRGQLVICTNTDEESGGHGALACTRHGVRADRTIVAEPTGLEVWPACRGSVYCTIVVSGRSGHAELAHPHWRDGGAVNAIEKARHVLAGIDHLRAEWQSRAASEHPLLPPPDLVVTGLQADSGWDVTIPDAATITLAALILPAQADERGWTSAVQQQVSEHLQRWCAADSWLAANPPQLRWHTEVNPHETPAEDLAVQALLGANRALGLPLTLGGLGSWYDGATWALETGSAAMMYGPGHIDRAHTVAEYVTVEELVRCAQGLVVAAHRLLS